MRIVIQNTAHNSIDGIFDYLYNYSYTNAIETVEGIYDYIYNLESSPYIGRHIPEILDKHFRELIFRKFRQARYRIIYYVSESSDTIYIISVLNCKQDFKTFLKLHNYFKDYNF